ncbi:MULTISPECIES: VOC family protein [Streptomyces]|uniref:VOC family protein n=1 Tax=Streptomyces lycii TaxID=2654337 RepID=A0ABQ7FGQ1_9ACTN|nr:MULTISPECIES: VOC family protein [Streptomyces]KAF4408087.1 VOC family protein [Streptomyces lycii]PGH47599.1 hydroxylase [Streptomyces sp. Ru87]
MLITDNAPGTICWVDLGAPDTAAAVAFYGSVFGWDYQDLGPEGGGYGLFQRDGRTVAGLGPLTEEGARSAWTVYFTTEDVDATADSARRLGGSVRAEPFDIGPGGRIAQLSDPQGGRFAVCKPGPMGSLEAVEGHGGLTWVELMTPDSAAGLDFYRSLFGWQTQDMAMPGGEGTYTLLTPEGLPEERMQGGAVQLSAEYLQATGGDAYWHPVFGVDDCDAAVAAIREHGGAVHMGPEDAEGVGRLAVGTDVAGAEFVVLKGESGG